MDAETISLGYERRNAFTTDVRRRAVDAVLEGMTKSAVAMAYGVDRKTVSRWVLKFENGGQNALCRQFGSGRPRKLEDLTEEELLRIVLSGAESFGFETSLWTRCCRNFGDQSRWTVTVSLT